MESGLFVFQARIVLRDFPDFYENLGFARPSVFLSFG